MSPNELQSANAKTVNGFVERVEGAVSCQGSLVRIEGVKGRIRIKRAAKVANQIHVGRGEPIVVHVPGPEEDDDDDGCWYVLPVRWQLHYARTHAKTANQHASHAFDCMAIRASEFDAVGATLMAVDPADLRTRCVQALEEAQDRVLRMMIKAINAARDAVADALIDTLQQGLFDEPLDDDDD